MARRKITKRKDDRVAIQVYTGTVDGVAKYKHIYGKTQKDAEEKEQLFRAKIKKGLNIEAENDTFEEWGKRWLKLKKYEVAENWYKSYEINFEKLKDLYNIPIPKMRAFDIQDIITELSSDYSKKTLLAIKSMISQIFKLAIENRVLEYNPTEYIKIPNKASKNERRALTKEEQQWVIDTNHRAQTAAMIMMYSGLRRGELIPLTWNDVDITNKTISVNKSVEMINGQPNIKRTAKTKTSIRTIDIPNVLVEYLKEQPKNSIYICTSIKGEILSDSAWKRMWDSYLLDLNLKYGDFKKYYNDNIDLADKNKKIPKSKYDPKGVPFIIPRFTPHWLRHTFATLLYMAGVDVLTAKEQLGHSDIRTTLEIYTHLDREHKRKSMDKLDTYLSDDKKGNAIIE